MLRGFRVLRGARALWALLPLGFGPLFGLRTPRTANIGPKSAPRPPTYAPRAAFWIALPLGFGPLFGLISCPDRFPARARATFRPDPLPRPTALAPRQAKTVNLGPDPLPRPTTLAPRQAKTANLGPDPLPRPPTWALICSQDRLHRP